MSAMASPLRAMLKKHAPGALCLEIDLTRQSFVAGATRAVAVLVPDLSLEVVPGSLAKLHPQGFQAIPVSQTFRQGVATLAPSQSSHHFLLGGVAVTGFLLLAEGKSEKHQGVIELLKEQLSSVTEKVGQLETENRKLREDASKRERELSHELQTEISRQAHKENMAQIRNDEIRLEIEKLRVMKGGDEGGDKRSGGEKPEDQKKTKTEEDKNKNEDKEPTNKKIFRYFMYPSTAEEFVKSVYNNCVNLTKVGGFGVFLVGMSRCDWLSFYTGGAKGLDTRNEILDIGICPCGIPWPEVCCKCGRSLPPFAADAAFLFGHASVGKDGTHTSAGQSVSKIGPAN